MCARRTSGLLLKLVRHYFTSPYKAGIAATEVFKQAYMLQVQCSALLPINSWNLCHLA
ncbi:unnamed protein product [Cylicocyclus nassatus]|uniref:Uncharacterized protein n=1 Tax=Cylicocyclus nassatus TaxID=53992 RepID=A0AA36HAV8_CYLNA|nr:unnamed protein product [Cylicocyclus nassatus]